MTNATAVKKAVKQIGSVELSVKALKALVIFNKAKATEAKAKALKARAEAILRVELGSATVGTIEGIAALKVIASSNTHFDRELMKTAYTEAYEATIRTTEYDYLKSL